MTEFDKKLIEEARALRRWDYRKIDAMIEQAQTNEAREQLWHIRQLKYDLVLETI